MKTGFILLALIATAAPAQTRHEPAVDPRRESAHVALDDTQCLIVTLPGFDPQVLTPGQIARMRARMVNGNPVSRHGLGSRRGRTVWPQPLR